MDALAIIKRKSFAKYIRNMGHCCVQVYNNRIAWCGGESCFGHLYNSCRTYTGVIKLPKISFVVAPRYPYQIIAQYIILCVKSQNTTIDDMHIYAIQTFKFASPIDRIHGFEIIDELFQKENFSADELSILKQIMQKIFMRVSTIKTKIALSSMTPFLKSLIKNDLPGNY